MSDEDLVKRLRTSWDTQRSIMLQTDAWMSERHLAADRIEALTAERDEALWQAECAKETLSAWFDRRELGPEADAGA